MAKQKKNPPNKTSIVTTRTTRRDRPQEQPLAPPTRPGETKRKIADLSHFFKKQQSISPPTVQHKFSLHHFLKKSSIQSLVIQCPNLKKAVNKIKQKISIEDDLLYGVLQRYFQNQMQMLWCDKYQPRNLKQSLHISTGQKIKIWLKSFYKYRNTIFEESNSFIDECFNENSNTQLNNMKQFNWKLKGLIVKGRPGVGKRSTVISTAKDINCEIYHCGNECNQIKYLKQKNEATQSESVKTKINKNQSLIQKTNQRITTFAVSNEQTEVADSQTHKIQFMHNVDRFYPEQDEIKFYNELKKTIESSKIPFLMTLTGHELSQNLKIYDVIQFQEAKTEDISTLLYLIYNIQKSFQRYVNTEIITEKDRYKQKLNEQFDNFQFQISATLPNFIKLTEIFNKKFDSLINFIQKSKRCSNIIDIENAQREIKLSLRKAESSQLLRDYFSINFSNKFQDQSSPQNTFQFIDTSKYLVQQQNQKCAQQDNEHESMHEIPSQKSEQNKKEQNYDKDIQKCSELQDGDLPTFIFTPNKQEKYSNQYFQKTKTNKKPQCKQVQTLKDYVRNLDLKVREDYRPSVQNDECFIFSKLYNSSREQLQESLMQNIPIKTHYQIRKNILRNVKSEFYQQNEIQTSIKQKQLNFIGFLIDSRSRISRKRNFKEDLNLKKYLKTNQINYLQNFTDFLKPGSLMNKF